MCHACMRACQVSHVVRLITALYSGGIKAHAPYDDCVMALRLPRAPAQAVASVTAGPPGAASTASGDGPTEAAGQGVSTDTGAGRGVQGEKGWGAALWPFSGSGHSSGGGKGSSGGTGGSWGGQPTTGQAAEGRSGGAAVAAAGGLASPELSLWQIQTVYNVLRGLEHPDASVFEKVSPWPLPQHKVACMGSCLVLSCDVGPACSLAGLF